MSAEPATVGGPVRSYGTVQEVVVAALEAHARHDWDGLRKLFHPEARIGVFAGGGEPGDPEKAISDMRRSYDEDWVYQASVRNLRQLDDHAVLLHGRVRYTTSFGGVADVERFWLYVVRDSLLYRSAVFVSPEDAEAAYESRGLTLGA